MSENELVIQQSAEELKKVHQLAVQLLQEHKSIENQWELLAHEIKEHQIALGCLEQLFDIITNDGYSLEKALKEALDLILSSWQYPDESSARIILGDRQYATSNFIVETNWKTGAEIIVDGEARGSFEVFYMEERPDDFHGYLKWEDRRMVTAFARGIGLLVEHRQTVAKVKEYARRVAETQKECADKASQNIPKLKRLREMADQSRHAVLELLDTVADHLAVSMESIRDQAAGQPVAEDKVSTDNRPSIPPQLDDLYRLVNLLQGYASIATGEVKQHNEQFSLRKAVETAVEPFTIQAAEKGIDIIIFIDPLVPDKVVSDEEFIKSILGNLLDYSLSRSSPGTVLVRVTLEASSHLLPIFHFQVIDNGASIGEEERQTMLEIFEQPPATYKNDLHGALCLTIARQLVDIMGGEIHIDGNARDLGGSSRGNTFHFTAWMDIVQPEIKESPEIEFRPLQNRKILVLEGNPIYRDLFQIFFDSWGATGTIIGDGQEALRAIEESTRIETPFMAIILDAGTPSINGQTIAEFILANAWVAKDQVILTVSSRTAMDPETVKMLAVDHIIYKPFNMSQLLELLLRCQPSVDAVVETVPPPERTEKSQDGAVGPESDETGPKNEILLVSPELLFDDLSRKILYKRGFAATHVFAPEETADYLKSRRPDLIVINLDSGNDYVSGQLAVLAAWQGEHQQAVPMIGCLTQPADPAAEPHRYPPLKTIIARPANARQWLELLGSNIRQSEPPAEKTYLPDLTSLPIFEKEKGLEFSGGDQEMLLEALDIFEEDTARRLVGLAEAFTRKDLIAVSKILGVFRDAARRLGAARIDRLAQHLFEISRQPDTDCAATLDALQKEFTLFQKEVTQFERLTI